MIHRLRRKTRGTGDIDGVVETDRAGEGERDCQRRISTGSGHHAGHGLVDIDPVGSAQHGLAALEGRPGKADARLKVLVVLVIDRVDVCPHAHERSASPDRRR